MRQLADFSWDVEPEDGYPIIAFNDETEGGEVVFKYNYTGPVSLYEYDCLYKADSASLSFATDYDTQGEIAVNVDIIQETIRRSNLYAQPNATTASIQFCARVDYEFEEDSLNFYETQVTIDVDLTANFTLDQITAVRTPRNLTLTSVAVMQLCDTTTDSPTMSNAPSTRPTSSVAPYVLPSLAPSGTPTVSSMPSDAPSSSPSGSPSAGPTPLPSSSPSIASSQTPSGSPSDAPSCSPSVSPSHVPSLSPSVAPSQTPSESPSEAPPFSPSVSPSGVSSVSPSKSASLSPSATPSDAPSGSPSTTPSQSPTLFPYPFVLSGSSTLLEDVPRAIGTDIEWLRLENRADEVVRQVNVTGFPTGTVVSYVDSSNQVVTQTSDDEGLVVVFTGGTEARIRADVDSITVTAPGNSDVDFALTVTVLAETENELDV